MKKRTIRLTVENEYVRGAGVPVGAAGSHDEVELEVTFVGDVWLGTNKYVTFRDALGQSPRLKMLLDSESVSELSEDEDGATIQTHKVTVPYAAKTHAGNMSVTFTGYTVLSTLDAEGNLVFYEGECINTMTAYFRVLPSDYVILEDGSFDGVPGATLAQQCQSAANAAIAAKDAAIEAKEVIEEAADKVANCALIPKYTLEPDKTIDTIDVNYRDSFPVECFNRVPTVGEIFYGFGRTLRDKIPFAITAEITGVVARDDGGENAAFKTLEVVPMVSANDDLGDIDAALDEIIAIQNSLMGG